MGHKAKVFYKRLASLLSIKWDRSYSNTLTWIRCCLSFSLPRSSIRCIRGYRSKCENPVRVRLSPSLDIIRIESRLQPVISFISFLLGHQYLYQLYYLNYCLYSLKKLFRHQKIIDMACSFTQVFISHAPRLGEP